MNKVLLVLRGVWYTIVDKFIAHVVFPVSEWVEHMTDMAILHEMGPDALEIVQHRREEQRAKEAETFMLWSEAKAREIEDGTN